MALAPAGWYPDPSGIPGAFRWWDGATWTTALGASPHAPAPLHAAPAGPTAPSGAGNSGQTAAGSTPQTASAAQQGQPHAPRHPGPDYEPAAWQPVQPPAQPPPPGAPTPASGGMGPGKIAALFSGVLVLVLALGGSYLYINRHHEPNRQSATATAPPTPAPPTPAPAQPTAPHASPTPTEPSTPRPSKSPSPPPNRQAPTPSQPQRSVAHFAFPDPPGQWIRQRNGVLVGPTQWQAYYQTTQADYDPAGHDWVAIMVSLAPSPAWGIHDNPKKGLRKAAAWYEAANFAGAAVHPSTVAERPITVDGKKGRYLQVHLRYRIKGLNSTGETATLVAVPTAHGAAMFLASIPDTNRNLQADVNAAVKALRLVN